MRNLYDMDEKVLAAFGQDVYRVGGSVRDEILGRESKDGDYVVRGRGMGEVIGELARVGGSVIPLKLRTGHVIGVRAQFRGIGTAEVVLPRREASTGSGRHDFNIEVSPEIGIAEDCLRRDFTINALYKHLWDGAIADPTSRGLYDLQHRLVCTTHESSFADDPLRMLRALRFVSCLGFDLSTLAQDQLRQHAPAATGLNHKGNMSGTVWDEFSRMLMGADAAKALTLGFSAGPLWVLFDDRGSLTPNFEWIETAAKLDAPLEVRLALVFWPAGWASFVDAVRPMTNMPKRIKHSVAEILANPVSLKGGGIPRRARFMRVEFGEQTACWMLQAAACMAAHAKNAQNSLGVVASLEKARVDARDAGVPLSVRELKVSGRDLMELGFEGADIGYALRELLFVVNRDPTPRNLTREGQMELACSGS